MSLKCKHSPHCLRLQPWLNYWKLKWKTKGQLGGKGGERPFKLKQENYEISVCVYVDIRVSCVCVINMMFLPPDDIIKINL